MHDRKVQVQKKLFLGDQARVVFYSQVEEADHFAVQPCMDSTGILGACSANENIIFDGF